MKIDNQEIRNLSKQLKIELNEEEIEKFSKSINRIVDELDILFQEDTKDITPTFSSVNKKQDIEKEVIEDECVDMNKKVSIYLSYTNYLVCMMCARISSKCHIIFR